MGKRILLVEDNDDIALVVKTTLTMRQYEVEVARDGVEGLRCAQSGEWDLIILDVLMPEMDGHEVLARLRKDPELRGMPVAFFSAHMTEKDSQKALEMGAVAVQQKPFDPKQFVQQVGELLAKD
jgi:CheY-like chemotaxis protein